MKSCRALTVEASAVDVIYFPRKEALINDKCGERKDDICIAPAYMIHISFDQICFSVNLQFVTKQSPRVQKLKKKKYSLQMYLIYCRREEDNLHNHVHSATLQDTLQ